MFLGHPFVITSIIHYLVVHNFLYDNKSHVPSYKRLVNVPVLSMVDDMLAISNCGQESISLNTYINTHVELKKLGLHTPDHTGKTKCHKMHVGCKNLLCPDLRVHDTLMKTASEDIYLGDVIRADGKNCSNIQKRVSKGLGLVTQIMTTVETISFGKSYFKIALSIREALFLSGILTNGEVWYNLNKSDLEDLEAVDRLLLRRILGVPESTSKEALYLETGCLDITSILQCRRLGFLHYLVRQEKNSMMYKFFKAQWDYPATGDWTAHARRDLAEFCIPESFEHLEEISEYSFSNLLRKKTRKNALEKFLRIKSTHSKLDNLEYSELKLQGFLESKDLNVEESKIVVKWRLRMAKFGANFGDEKKLCPLCKAHKDTQEDSFSNCDFLKNKVSITNKYEEIFTKPSSELAKSLIMIMKIRETEEN